MTFINNLHFLSNKFMSKLSRHRGMHSYVFVHVTFSM